MDLLFFRSISDPFQRIERDKYKITAKTNQQFYENVKFCGNVVFTYFAIFFVNFFSKKFSSSLGEVDLKKNKSTESGLNYFKELQ